LTQETQHLLLLKFNPSRPTNPPNLFFLVADVINAIAVGNALYAIANLIFFVKVFANLRRANQLD
jgi:hypothetical protein